VIIGDEIVCERYEEDLGGYLTVHVNNHCQLNYKIDRLGRQFGQFWLMDRYENRILSRSLIGIQVYVLENILCQNQTKLILPNQSNYTRRKLHQSIEIPIRLYSNCDLIKSNDQTIIEITTLCMNNSTNVLENGGIEVLFQCQLNLCGIYHVCFVGEMGLKLPATEIQCLSIEIIGSSIFEIFHRIFLIRIFFSKKMNAQMPLSNMILMHHVIVMLLSPNRWILNHHQQ
jgi:hypothetical protein